MNDIVTILLVVAAVKFVLFGGILYFIFRPDVMGWLRREPVSLEQAADEPPVCMYCDSRYAKPTGEVQTRWEQDDLVVVTTFECEHCHFPIWRVERIPVGTARR